MKVQGLGRFFSLALLFAILVSSGQASAQNVPNFLGGNWNAYQSGNNSQPNAVLECRWGPQNDGGSFVQTDIKTKDITRGYYGRSFWEDCYVFFDLDKNYLGLFCLWNENIATFVTPGGDVTNLRRIN